MSIHFKFRSSAKFDSVDVEGGGSISVRDLKAKIIRHKNLNICQDSDLVFSDAITGQEYKNENIQILCGSSVIIKRVPAGSIQADVPHLNSYEAHHCKDSGNVKSLVRLNVETVDFDDFGVDLYPVEAVPEAPLLLSEHADRETRSARYMLDTDVTRCLDPAVASGQKLEASGLSDAIPGGKMSGGVEQSIPKTNSKREVQEDMNVEKICSTDPLDKQHADLPSEMKCVLCNSFFKEAVMIPCCQHSFCEKCIRQVLLEKARCPKCFSVKCRVEDLLPNISLRKAIEHFLESKILASVADDVFCQYAPDGESGIQAKDVSCGGTNLQRELNLHHSPESTCNPPFKKDASYHRGAKNTQNFPLFSHKNNKIDGETHDSNHVVPDGLASFDDFQGESMPVHEEAKPAFQKKRPPWVHTAGGDKTFSESGRQRKGDRTCYMCGSPDHLIRECPVASSPRPMLHAGNAFFQGAMPGFVPPYWNGAPSPHAPPYGNMYGYPGMTAFNTALIPPAPFAVPYGNYGTPSMYNSMPPYGGYPRMGCVAPLSRTGEDCYSNRLEYPDILPQEKRRKLMQENFRRDQSPDDVENSERHHYNGTARSPENRCFVNREKSVTYSSDDTTKRSRRQYRRHNYIDDDKMLSTDGQRKSSHLVVNERGQKLYHRTEKSSSEIDDMPSNSSWHSEEKQTHYHRSSRKEKDRREHYGSDSSWSHHEKNNKRKRNEHELKRHNKKHHRHSGSGLEHGVSGDKKLQKESSHSSRKSKHSAKSNVDEWSHDRWKMVSGSDEDGAEVYQYCELKRLK